MSNQGSIRKQAPRGLGRSGFASGDYRARSLGEMAGKKYGRFKVKQKNCKDHHWIPGTEIEVCTECGTIREKASTWRDHL